MPIDYSKGKVYSLRNRIDNDKIVYVGSTVRTLSERMAQHRRDIKRNPEQKIYELMDRIGVDNFYIELIEDVACERREQLLAREGHFIRMHKTTTEGGNMQIAGRGKKERADAYYEVNRESILAKVKAYKETNQDKIRAMKHDYHAANSEKLNENSRAYRAAHKEELKAKNKAYNDAYRAAHKDEIKAQSRAYNLRKKAEREAQAQAPPVAD